MPDNPFVTERPALPDEYLIDLGKVEVKMLMPDGTSRLVPGQVASMQEADQEESDASR